MQVKVKAIVLHTQPYNDTTNVVHLYTEHFGRASYLAGKSLNKRSALKGAFFQPLSLVEVEVEHRPNRSLQRIREIRCFHPFIGIPFEPTKNAIALFLAEVLYRCLRDPQKDPVLFDYLVRSIQLLDLCHEGLANFHLVFLLRLTRFLGFYPNAEENRPDWYFDLQGGCFVPHQPFHNAWLNPADSARLVRLLHMNFENAAAFRFSRSERVNVLRQIINYYRLHLTEFPEIRSLAVLQELFED
jgi:DNA repair protein RecO (recombination protein O)